MERLKISLFIHTILVIIRLATPQNDDVFTPRGNISRYRFSFQKNKIGINDALLPTFSDFAATKNSTTKQAIKRFDKETFVPKSSARLDSYWVQIPRENFTARRDNIKKLDHSVTWPTWSSKKEIRNKKNRKYLDSIEDYLGLDSKYHEMADRKYIHEHEGFFFPIHVPSSHHEKDDHLIPLLLLLLLPLLLFAIIIPLNANLLSTLFLIMQNNGATTTAAQLAAAGRRRRDVFQASHPLVEHKIMEALHKLSALDEFQF